MEKFKEKLKDYEIQNYLENHNYIHAAKQARKWIERNTIQGKGIVITSKQRTIYQEVTGYYIPTLLQWGVRDKAISYAKYLCEIQEESGAWLNGSQNLESVFNTGQVLRGLLAVADIYPEACHQLIKGCDWLISNVNEEGRLVSTEGTTWTIGTNSEAIHLYCLPPLLEAGKKYGKQNYIETVNKVADYYLREYSHDISNFMYLSHFYAYIMEALLDIGRKDVVEDAMKKIAKIQRIDGAIPAYRNCYWVCSTGLFQLAIVWFKLGDGKRGNKAFDYAVKLQNKSGGWYGGYPARVYLSKEKKIPYCLNEKVTYFENEEISWAVKYFFDALYYRQKCEFKQKAHTFVKHIDSEDPKYQAVLNELYKIEQIKKIPIKVADIGCGKGRYLKKMVLSHPDHLYYGIDISAEVLKYVNSTKIETRTGNLLNTGCKNDYFDLVYAAESIEHAIFIDLAVREMYRITKVGGSIVVIDKDVEAFQTMKYREWFLPEELSTKQWLDTDEMINVFRKCGIDNMEIIDIPSHEGKMYKAYIGRKEK